MTADWGRRSAMAGLASTLATYGAIPIPARADSESRLLVIDDFQDRGGARRGGPSWMGFTDQVMGGRSTGGAKYDLIDGRRCLRLTGRVNTDGGGFVQMAVDLARDGKAFDASGYAALELDVWGNDESYNCHIRSTDVRWYEQSYRATFHAPRQWTRIKLPWSQFVPHGLTMPLDLTGLMRVGLLGWMRDFDADLALSRIALT